MEIEPDHPVPLRADRPQELRAPGDRVADQAVRHQRRRVGDNPASIHEHEWECEEQRDDYGVGGSSVTEERTE